MRVCAVRHPNEEANGEVCGLVRQGIMEYSFETAMMCKGLVALNPAERLTAAGAVADVALREKAARLQHWCTLVDSLGNV